MQRTEGRHRPPPDTKTIVLRVEDGARLRAHFVGSQPCPHPALVLEHTAAGEWTGMHLCTICGELLEVARIGRREPVLESVRGKDVDLRRSPRIPTQLSCWFWPDGQGDLIHGTCVNLSMVGCAILSEVTPEHGRFGRTMVGLTDTTPLLVDISVIRRVAEKQFGVEFVALRPDDLIRLRQYIDSVTTIS